MTTPKHDATPAPEPTVAELLAAAEAKVTKANEAAAKAVADAAATKAELMAKLDEQMKPFRDVRDDINAQVAELRGTIAENETKAKAALAKKNAPLEESIAELLVKREANEVAATEATGAPAVLLNADIAPAPKAKAAAKSGAKATQRKNVRVGDLPVMGPFDITAPKRYPLLDPSNPITVRYEVIEKDGEQMLCSKRIDKVVDHEHVIDTEAVEGPYLHCSADATKACTSSGWHAVPDVLYALAKTAGILGEFPEYSPSSDLSDIAVDGQPLAEASTVEVEAEATIQETV